MNKNVPYATSLATLALALSGCASTLNPIFNSSVSPPRIYADHEKQPGFGVPTETVGATGEVRYCQAGVPQVVQARQQQAHAAIAKVCGGKERYEIQGELMSDATGSMFGVNFQCVGNAGRAIVFKCKGAP